MKYFIAVGCTAVLGLATYFINQAVVVNEATMNEDVMKVAVEHETKERPAHFANKMWKPGDTTEIRAPAAAKKK